MQAVSPAHPKLIAMLDAGITVAELVDAASEAVKTQKPFAYALATAEGRRRDAATAPLPSAKPNGKHTGFQQLDYSKGVNADGSFN